MWDFGVDGKTRRGKSNDSCGKLRFEGGGAGMVWMDIHWTKGKSMVDVER